MSDQAEMLRHMVQATTEADDGKQKVSSREWSAKAQRGPRIIAVTSGKGGVGKTNFVINLSMVIAGMGAKVTIMDADMGLANIDVVLGMSPRHNLYHVIHGTTDIRDVIIRGPRDVEIIPGASGLRGMADLAEEARAGLISSLDRVVAGRDLLLLDTGAGLSRNVLDFVLATREVIVITAPEPTALADAFAMIKGVSRDNTDCRIHLVVNMSSTRDEGKSVSDHLVLLSERFLNTRLEPLGHMPFDPLVSKAVKQRQPFVLAYPYSPVSSALQAIAMRLWDAASAETSRSGLLGFLRGLAGLERRDGLKGMLTR